MNEQAKEARRAYKREWNRRNREKVKAAQDRYWNRKAAEAAAAAAAETALQEAAAELSRVTLTPGDLARLEA